jgi:hypothetical protein
MKKSIFYFAFIAILGVSCSKDSDDNTATPSTSNELILGTWSGDEMTSMGSITGGASDTTFSETNSLAGFI